MAMGQDPGEKKRERGLSILTQRLVFASCAHTLMRVSYYLLIYPLTNSAQL
jgi:hypothetical protein